MTTSTKNLFLRIKGLHRQVSSETRVEQVGHEQALDSDQTRQVQSTYTTWQRVTDRRTGETMIDPRTGRPLMTRVEMEREEIDTYSDHLDFAVRSVEGSEGISELFSFDLVMISDNTDLDLSALLYKPAILTMTRLFGPSPGTQTQIVRHGILADIQLVGREPTGVSTWNRIYKARLVPRLWQLSIQQHSQVFLGKTLKQIVGQVLDGAGFDAAARTDKMTGDLPSASRDMVMQYQESDLDFISRWLEEQGVHYTFIHDADEGGVDKLVLCDTANFTAIDPPLSTMSFRDDAFTTFGYLDDDKVTEMVGSQQRIPKRVVLQGYDWKNPSAGYITSIAQVDQSGTAQSARGIGDHFEYQARFSTKSEGDVLAKIRAEEFYCREVVFTGTSRSPFFRAGGKFTLQGHYDTSLNGEYLLIKVTHHATQDATAPDQDGQSWSYHNEFVAVPTNRTFRPQRRTPWPSIKSMLNAKIYDDTKSTTVAPVDSSGCYLVQLPFAIDTTSGTGQATCRIRMARTYAGTDFGMHFPLYHDTEVTLSFLDGDPDRPVITGALFDGTHTDPVNDANATQGGIKTASGSALSFEDTGENSRVTLSAGSGGAAIAVGTLGKSHTGPLTMDQVQLYASKLDLFGGLMSANTSPLIINNSVLKWMAVTSPLNILFMLAPLVSKSGQDGKDPILGITVSSSEQENIEAANMVAITLAQTVLQLMMANILAAKSGYAAEMSMITGKPSALTKAGRAVLEFVKTWPLMLVGGKGSDGVSITATGLLNKVDSTGFATNVSIFAKGSVKLAANENILGLAQSRVQFVAPEYQFMVGNQVNLLAAITDKKGSINLDEDEALIHHGTEVNLTAGIGPLPPVHSSLKLVKSEITLKSKTLTFDSWDQAAFGAGLGLMKLAQVNLDGRPGSAKVELNSKEKVTIDALTDITMNAGAFTAKIAMGATGIKLSFGASSLEIGPAGITIKGPLITIEGTKVSIDGKTLTEVNGGLLSIKPQSIVGIG